MDILGKTLRSLVAVASLFGLMLLPACAGKQMYQTGQAWQTNKCSKISHAQEHIRCMEKANTSYEDYMRQQEASQDVK